MTQHIMKAGDRCGAFRITRLLGSSRAAEVYEAVHFETGQAAVVRRLRADQAETERMRQRMMDETAVLRKVQHANVAAVLEDGVQEGIPFAALEHVEGKSLRERLDGAAGRVSMAVALCFVRQIADGAAALHAAGAAHGDLRPESIRLTDIDEVKLCDLGPGAPLDSPGTGDVRGDIRAVGMILGEMLAGEAVKVASLSEQLASAPPFVRQLIHKLISGDAESGFRSMTEVVEAIDATWSRLLQDNRAGKGLRQALETLKGALKAMGPPSGDNGEDAGRSEADEEEELAALLKGVVDATQGLDLDDADTDDGEAAPTGPA